MTPTYPELIRWRSGEWFEHADEDLGMTMPIVGIVIVLRSNLGETWKTRHGAMIASGAASRRTVAEEYRHLPGAVLEYVSGVVPAAVLRGNGPLTLHSGYLPFPPLASAGRGESLF
jgi:hypothetical protein